MKSWIQKIFQPHPFNVFPNPATKGKVVNLVIKNSGNYAVQLIDKNSEPLHEQEVSVSNSNEVKLFNIPASIDKGLYYIKLINRQTTKAYTDSILVL